MLLGSKNMKIWKKPFGFDIFFGSFAAFLLIANGAEVTKSVVGEAKEMAKLVGTQLTMPRSLRIS